MWARSFSLFVPKCVCVRAQSPAAVSVPAGELVSHRGVGARGAEALGDRSRCLKEGVKRRGKRMQERERKGGRGDDEG